MSLLAALRWPGPGVRRGFVIGRRFRRGRGSNGQPGLALDGRPSVGKCPATLMASVRSRRDDRDSLRFCDPKVPLTRQLYSAASFLGGRRYLAGCL